MIGTEPNAHLRASARDVLHTGLSAKQLESVRESTGLVNIWEGAVSSGKTVASMFRWLTFLAQTADLPGEVVCTGRTRESAWRNVLLPMMDLFPGCVEGNMGSPTCRILNQRVNVIGAADSKAESVLRGITAKSIYMDEVTTIPESYFQMALSRLRVAGRSGGLASKLFGSTNPDNPQHWLKRDYLDKIGKDAEITSTWRSFHFALDDNPRLPTEYLSAMRAQYTGLFYKRFILGQWVQGEGAIWDCWDPDRHVVDVSELTKMDRVLALGVDFGSNHESAGLLVGVADSTLWVLAEWAPMRTDGTTLSPSKQSQLLRQWIADRPIEWQDPEFIFVDSAALAFRQQLYEDGLPTAPAWKSVTPGIQLVHSLLSLDRLRVLDQCTNLIEQMPSYVWDARAVAAGRDEPVKEKDDFCDALRYAIASSRPQWQGLVPLLLPTAAQEEVA